MKILTLFGGKEFPLEDDEADNIILLKKKGSKDFLKLRCGAFVDSSAIQVIESVPLKAFYDGYEVINDKWFVRDGDRIYVEHRENIKWLPDPKYQEKYPLLTVRNP